ncbi:modular serine protease-like [Battus philenor]|uniref:modular serine protease-like n=1 Tax=Battus philenor TaxID=42288 RepID=UPI0035CFDD2F
MKHRSVQYNCIIPGTEATRPCRDSELDGTVVQPTCQRPHYYTPLELPYMTCAQGRWNAWPTCIPECGLLSSEVSSGTSTSTRVPWHAAIFSKNITAATHEHICSGSLISNSVVLSAAHCFWSDSSKALKEETNFAVAVGKLYSSWSHHDDEQYVQRSDVKKIVVPKGYRGADGDDLAVVVVSQAFEYQLHVRPICLDFKRDLFDRQLVVGNHGKSAGWSVPTNEVSSTKALQVIDMPFVSNGDCVTKSSVGDKLCAGNVNGPGLCDTDSGSGLVFSATLQNTTRYYLRGVVTTRLSTSEACNSFTTFTSIMKYQKLIKTYWFL